jgi:hypothetical protein
MLGIVTLTSCAVLRSGVVEPQANEPDYWVAEEIAVDSELAMPAGAPAAAPAEEYRAARITDMSSDDGGVGERLVIKNANLSIVVEAPGDTLDRIGQLAEEMGGFIVSSNLYQTYLESGMEVPRANITIRVPAENLTDALDAIKDEAGQVLSENVSGQDVTQEYTDLQSQLRNKEMAEAQLQEIMASAFKTEDVLAVYNQLTWIREEIEVIKGRIQYYEQSASMSAISVDILADEAVQPLTIGGWQPVGVAKDAIQALINTLKFLANTFIWLLLYILPVVLVLSVFAWVIWRGVRRMRSRLKVKKPPAAKDDK